jgi:phenylpyruvate tautomerase PptA (4-oxalocrotonate tautomerase family)
MPFLHFHTFEGRSDEEIASLLDAAHRVVLDAFHAPVRDRYQILHEYKPSRVRFEDTGLDIPRTNKFVLLEIITRHHTQEEKTNFYRLLCTELERSCNIKASDVMITIVENSDENWSFGLGRAQFLTGELGNSAAQRTTKQTSNSPSP